MPTNLSVFSWTDDQPNGFNETNITDMPSMPFGEIDLLDAHARQLMTYIKTSLENNEHVTLRLS